MMKENEKYLGIVKEEGFISTQKVLVDNPDDGNFNPQNHGGNRVCCSSHSPEVNSW